MSYEHARSSVRHAHLLDVALGNEKERKKDPKERYLIQLLSNGERDRASLRSKIKMIESERVKSEKRKESLRLDVAFLREEVMTIATKNEKMFSDLTAEIQRLKKLKQAMNEQNNQESMLNLPTMIEVGRYKGASVASAPQGVKKRREHDLYRQKFEINRNVANTDAGFGWSERETNGFILNSSVPGSPHRSFQIPRTEAFFSRNVENTALSFLDLFCKLKSTVLRSLWERYVETSDRDSGDVLYIINLPIFLDNLVLFIYKKKNPRRSLPSRKKTKPLVSFLEFKLAPYIGKKKYITLKDFLQFPIWFQGRKSKFEVLPMPYKEEIECMTHEEKTLREQLKVGSACNIWSKTEKKWCKGKVISTKLDNVGEWLIVRYSINKMDVEKEVQRFSNLLDISCAVTRGASLELKDYLEKFEI